MYRSSHRFKKNNRIAPFRRPNFQDPKFRYDKVRFQKNYVPRDPDVIIIGSGMGSLTTACLLSLSGKQVLVLEQHDTAGGTLHTFEDRGVEFETGLHYVGNIPKNKKIYDLLTQNKLEWCQMGRETESLIYDEIIIGKNKYQLPSGKKNLISYLQNLFPEEEKGIANYFDLIEKVGKRDLFFKLKCFPYPSISKFIKYLDPIYYQYVNLTTEQVIDTYIQNSELKSVLTGQFGDYGISPQTSSFYLHATVVNHYLEGAWYPKGGSAMLSNLMCRTIWENGGTVLVNQKVKKICREYGEVVAVEMEKGDKIYSSHIVSGVGVRNTFTKLIWDNRYQKLLKQIPPSVQHIFCFVKLKGTPEELNLPSYNSWIYPDKNYESLLNNFYQDPQNSEIPMFIGFSSRKDESWNARYPGYSNVVILSPFPKSYLQNWQNQRCGKRDIDYRQIKMEMGQRLINEGLHRYFPQTINSVVSFTVGTPLSSQYYLGCLEGESYGLETNIEKLLEGEFLRPKTPIPNLYLTGQDICSLGISGAMMGGILTANVLAGYGNIEDIYLGNNIVQDLLDIKK